MRTRYWTAYTKRASWKLMWTIERVEDPKGRMRFRAKRLKSVKSHLGFGWNWEIKQTRYFRFKWKAKDWCWKWYCHYDGTEFHSLHTISEGRREQGRKLQRLAKKKEIQKEDRKAGLKCTRRRKVLRRKILKKEINLNGFGSFLEPKEKTIKTKED